MHRTFRLLPILVLLPSALLAQATFYVTFDDLPTLPATNSFAFISAANNGSLVYDGITWSATFVVVGKDYVEGFANTGGSHPFATPESGSYALFNASAVDKLSFTNVAGYALTGAWFARSSLGVAANGTNQVTVRAIAADQSLLGSVTLNLTSTTPAFMDLSSFAALGNIASYEVDRFALGSNPANGGDSYGGGHYIMDQLTFTSTSAIPEPATYAVWAGLGALGLAVCRSRKILPRRAG